jgi:serine O-acetyltransferase
MSHESANPDPDPVGQITDRLMQSYQELPAISQLDDSPLPNSAAVIRVAQRLQELLFPGYRQREEHSPATTALNTMALVRSLLPALTSQISRALCYRANCNGSVRIHGPKLDFEPVARSIAVGLLESLPEIRRVLAQDAEAAHAADPASLACDEIVICYPGLEAISVYRLAHQLHVAGVPLIPRMLTEWAHSRTGIDIHPGATIGESFFIDHGTGVVIGETCEIADHVTLYQGVTLGAVNFPRDEDGNIIRGQKRHPTLEAGVIVYSNASVLGGETVIGAGSIVGAGASVMNREIPPGTLVTVEKPTLRFREAA